MYIVGDNNLTSALTDDVIALERYFPKDNKAKFFIFHDKLNGDGTSEATLYELENCGWMNEISSPILESYGVVNACDMTTFHTAMDDIKAKYPEIIVNNVTMSSHAYAWLPSEAEVDQRDRSFGVDESAGGSEINIEDLAEGLERYNLDVLIFDACHMSAIEVYYELRNSAKQIIASPAEILADGFPYEALAEHYSTGKFNPDFILQKFYDKYSAEGEQGGTITYVNTEYLEEFAALVKELLEKYNYSNINQNMNRLPNYSRSGDIYFYDFYSMFKNLKMSKEDTGKLNVIWYKCFPKYLNTPTIIGHSLSGTNGISYYPPNLNEPAHINDYYKSLKWATASGIGSIIK